MFFLLPSGKNTASNLCRCCSGNGNLMGIDGCHCCGIGVTQFGGGAYEKGEIKTHATMREAYEMGKGV